MLRRPGARFLDSLYRTAVTRLVIPADFARHPGEGRDPASVAKGCMTLRVVDTARMCDFASIGDYVAGGLLRRERRVPAGFLDLGAGISSAVSTMSLRSASESASKSSATG